MTPLDAVLADQLALTGGTFDPAPWIVGGLIAIALGAFAMLALGRRRRKADAQLEASPRGEGALPAAGEAEAEGHPLDGGDAVR